MPDNISVDVTDIVQPVTVDITSTTNVIQIDIADGISVPHNSLINMQGGATNAYYHMTSAQHSGVLAHPTDTANPHAVTKTQVGLGSVDNLQQLPMSYLSTDGTLVDNSDVAVPSEQAVKTYADTNRTAIFSGVLTTPTITYRGSGLLDVSSCTVRLFSTSDFSGIPLTYTVPAVTDIQLVANTYYYLSVNYNGGSPAYSLITDNTLVNHSDVLNCWQFVWEKLDAVDEFHKFFVGNYGTGLANKISHRIIHTDRFGYQEGLLVTEYGTRNLTQGKGVVWYDGTEIAIPSANSIMNPLHFYYHAGGQWKVSTVTQYINNQYDDGTNLQTLTGASKYTVNWIYRWVSTDVDAQGFLLLGNGTYSLQDALDSLAPTPPIFIQKQAVLCARVIVKNGVDTAYKIESAFDTAFQASVALHNDLPGLQGGIDTPSAQYYHLTSTEYTGTGTGTFVKATNPTVNDITISDMGRSFATLGNDTKHDTGVPWAERGKFKLALSYSAPNIKASIQFVGANTSFSYYIKDKKYTVTDLTTFTDIPATAAEGVWFFYISQSNVPTLTQIPWTIVDPDVLMWNFYFNNTDKTFTWVGEERHSAGRDIFQHARNHAQGAIYKTGLLLSQYNGLTAFTTNNDNNWGRAQIQISGGSFFDEDILNTIVHTDASITSTTAAPATDWNLTVSQFLGFTALAAVGTTPTSLVFPTSRTLPTGKTLTIMAGNTTTIRGTTTITTGGTGTTFTTATLSGMQAGDAIVVPARIPIYYISAVSGSNYTWRRLDATSSFLGVSGGAAYTTANIGSGAGQFNNPAGGFSTITAGRYYPMFLCATNMTSEPIIAILGQAQSTNSTLTTALNEAGFQFQNLVGLSGLSIQEIVPFYRLAFEYNSTGTFTNARIRLRTATFIDLRVTTASGSVLGSPTSAVSAGQVTTDTTNFDKVLSTTDTTVQAALDTIDETVPKITDVVEVIGTFTETHKVKIKINGVVYYMSLMELPS